MAISQTQLNQLYLAYFGRPADFDGLVFYTSNPNFDIWSVAAAFSASPESQALYGAGVAPNFISASTINAIYQNLFNRDAEPAGLAYWAGEVASGRLSAAGAAYGILIGAQNDDAIAVANKLAASAAFTAAMDTAPEIIGYNGDDAAAAARAWLATVTADPATLTAALAGVDAALAAVIAVGGTIGDTITLTTTVDSITITDSTTIDTVQGVVDGTTSTNSTFSIGDTIDGNGKTILSLSVADDGAIAFANVKDIAKVNVIAGATGTLDINAVSWSNIGSINLAGGVDGLDLEIAGLSPDTDLSVSAAVSGSIFGERTDNIDIFVQSDRGSSVAYVDGNVTGVVDAGGYGSFSMSAQADGVAMTVGDVSITGAGDAWFGFYNSQDKGGNMTVGDVDLSADGQLWFTVTNLGHTAASAAVSTTVGNVSLSIADTSTLSNAYIGLASAGKVGNLAIGDFTLNMGASNSGTVEIDQTGVKAAGNFSIGTVAINVGDDSNNVNFDIDVNADYAGTDATTVTSLGTMTIGGLNMTLGMNATAEFDMDGETSATAGKSTIGNIVVGNSVLTLGQNAYADVYIEPGSAVATAGTATVGSVVWGNVDATAAVDSSFTYSGYAAYATTGGTTATVGDVVMGAATFNMGINTDGTYSMYVDAYGTDKTKTSIGNVTVGDVTMNMDDGANMDYSFTISSDGKLGDVSIGNLTITQGVSATASYSVDVSAEASIGNVSVGNANITLGVSGYLTSTVDFSASTTGATMGTVTVGAVNLTGGEDSYATVEYTFSASGDIGAVSIGDVSITAGKNADLNVSHTIESWAGDIASLSLGNVSVIAGASASATYDIFASAETSFGNITVGNVTVSAVGGVSASASADFDFENDFDGTIGSVTLGNVSVTANGQSAYAGFSVTVSSADSSGTLTVGDLDLSVGNASKKTGSQLDVTIGTSALLTGGAVVVGNIDLNGSSARAVGDATMTYTADVSIYSDSSITVGNITVTGGDAASENLDTLTSWLTLTPTTTATIGNVDYSGYASAATIDVSAWKGAAGIVGGAKGDTITDNSGVNTIAGGAGADTFVFVDTNTGVTAATIDNILDFSNAAGDKIDLSPVLVVAEYGEAVYADFAAFLVGAAAADKDVFVGQIGGDSYVAVDKDAGNAVDFVVKLTGVTLSTVDLASFV